MILNVQAKGKTGLLSAFAAAMGLRLSGKRLNIPERFGKGYLEGHILGPHLRLMIRNYVLYEDLLLKRRANASMKGSIVFAFHHVFTSGAVDPGSKHFRANVLPSVQITTGGMDHELFFPSQTRLVSIVVNIDVSYLKTLIGAEVPGHGILNALLDPKESMIFDELISPKFTEIGNEICLAQPDPAIGPFFYKVKAEELICQVLSELLRREDTGYRHLHVKDAERLYKLRDRILANLQEPPLMAELATFSGMSESRLKRLFRQIFGDSIYNYYQKFRILEAARLLREEGCSVSEAGYSMGFTNLSHFGQVFEKQIGLKPKKYAMQFTGSSGRKGE